MMQEESGVLEISQYYNPNDEVKVCDGSFDEQIGNILFLDSSGRIRMLIDLMYVKIILTTITERLLLFN